MADEIIKVDPNSERAFDSTGKEWTDEIYVYCRRRAHQAGRYLKHQIRSTDGKSMYRMVDIDSSEEFDIAPFVGGSYTPPVAADNKSATKVEDKPKIAPKTTKQLIAEIKAADIKLENEDDLVKAVQEAASFKPKFLKMSDTKWKLLVRSALRGKNIMMTGPSGEGKTVSVHCLSAALGRPFFYINMGNTQDAQTSLIGKTHFDSKSGTFFEESYFVKAIKTENAVILLDELSRMSDEASNILMSVLDETQRYLRLTEAVNSDKVEVAKGVTFVATANIGNEYTTTSALDRAILSRFVTVEVDPLEKNDKIALMKMMFPSVKVKDLENVVDLSEKIRLDYESDAPQVNTLLATRECIEVVGLIDDGFSFIEATTEGVLPLFSKEGGTQSPRTFVLQILQNYGDSTSESVDPF